MKKYANLLPKDAQKEIKIERITSRLLNLFLWVLISLGILIVLIVAARIYLASEKNRVSEQIVLQKLVVSQEENKEIKDELTEFNTHLSNLVKFENSHAYWSEVLIVFARLLPADMAIDTLSAEREDGQINVSGFASTRDSVLALRRNLLDSEFFEDVNFPLSNLIKPEDVNFRYSFFVNSEELLKKRISDTSIQLDADLEEEPEG